VFAPATRDGRHCGRRSPPGWLRCHTVVVPDRAAGPLLPPSGGYYKKTQASDVAAVLDTLKIDKVVSHHHDILNMVG